MRRRPSATCRRPGHPLSAPARRERDAYRLRARQRPLARGPRRRRRRAADQLRGRGDRSGVQRGRPVDRLFGTVRGQHRRLPDARHGRPTAAAHLAPGGGCGPGLDSGRRDPLPVGPGRGAHPVVEVLHGVLRRRAAGAARAPAGVPGRDVGGRGIHRLPGDRLLGPGMAQLPGRAGAADRHRLHRRLGARHALLGGGAAHGPGVDGRPGLLHVRTGLGQQRVVVRSAHGGGAATDAARRFRREVARSRGRRRGLRAGGVPARTGSRVRARADARDPRGRRHELVAGRAGSRFRPSRFATPASLRPASGRSSSGGARSSAYPPGRARGAT